MFSVAIGGRRGIAFGRVRRLLEDSNQQINPEVWAVLQTAVSRGWVKGKGQDLEDKIIEEYLWLQSMASQSDLHDLLTNRHSPASASGAADGKPASGEQSAASSAETSARTTQKSGKARP